MDAPSAAHKPAFARLRLEPRVRATEPPGIRLLITVVIYAAVVLACSLITYWSIFNGWNGFDDEGFFDYSLKTFVQGHSLYGSVYSEYGPIYYLLFGAFFKVTGLAVTTQAGRVITLVIWVVTSLGAGLAAHLYTRNLWIGLVSLCGTYSLLAGLNGGAMHAQILIVLFTVAIGAVVLLGLPRFARAAPFALGFLVSAMALVKINIGGYDAIAICFALVVAGPRWLRRRWLLALVAAGFVLVAPVLMSSEWQISQERMYAEAVAVSALAVALAAWPTGSTEEHPHAPDSLIPWLIFGALGCVVPVLLFMIASGASLTAWIQQTVIEPTHQGSLLKLSLMIDAAGVRWTILGLILAALYRWRRHLPSISGDMWPAVAGIARLAAGLLMIMPATGLFPFRGIAYPYLYAWGCVWVVVLPPSGVSAPNERLLRVMLASMAVLESLMAYPVAGSQVVLGGVLFVLCGAVCLADGVRTLRHWDASGRWLRSDRVAGVALVLLAGWAVYEHAWKPISLAHAAYKGSVPLSDARGVAGVRLQGDLAADVESLFVEIRREGCRTLLEFPGEYSLNLWTGIPLPSPLTGQQTYWGTLSNAQQTQLIDASRSSPRLCLLRNAGLINFYQGPNPLPDVPIVRYVDGDFRVVTTISGWSFELRRRVGG